NSGHSRNTSRDTTNSNYMWYQVANKARMLAPVTGSVAAGYSATLTAGVTLAVPAATSPTITTGGVGNAVSGAAGVASGSWVSIYGTNLATSARALTSSDRLNNA